MQWQKLYESCVFETNLARLDKLVFKAEDAIYLRSRELSKESHIANEVQALRLAARGLLEIKIKKLGWADPAAYSAYETPNSTGLVVPGPGPRLDGPNRSRAYRIG